MAGVVVGQRRAMATLAAVITVLLVAGSAVAQSRGDGVERIAFLARADNPVDALGASSVAAQLGGVVLLTDSSELSGPAASGLVTFGPDLVVLAGGVNALSPAVEEGVRALGFSTERVAGGSRLETAEAVAAFFATRESAYLGRTGTAVAALQADRAAVADAADSSVHALAADGADRAALADQATTAISATTAATATNALALGGRAPGDLVRVAYNGVATGVVPLGNNILSFTTVVQTTITAPTAGWISVDGSVIADGSASAAELIGCRIRVGDTSLVGSTAPTGMILTVRTGGCTSTGAVQVAAGSHVVRLDVAASASGMAAGHRAIRAIFTPFGPDGE